VPTTASPTKNPVPAPTAVPTNAAPTAALTDVQIPATPAPAGGSTVMDDDDKILSETMLSEACSAAVVSTMFVGALAVAASALMLA